MYMTEKERKGKQEYYYIRKGVVRGLFVDISFLLSELLILWEGKGEERKGVYDMFVGLKSVIIDFAFFAYY